MVKRLFVDGVDFGHDYERVEQAKAHVAKHIKDTAYAKPKRCEVREGDKVLVRADVLRGERIMWKAV